MAKSSHSFNFAVKNYKKKVLWSAQKWLNLAVFLCIRQKNRFIDKIKFSEFSDC